jgi:hypothetical protein
MPISNVTILRTVLAQGQHLSGEELSDAFKVLLSELETARRKVSDLESRVRSLESRRP